MSQSYGRRSRAAARSSACHRLKCAIYSKWLATMAPMGRPKGTGKGDRDAFLTRPMRPVGSRVRAEAQRLGMPYGEYISYVLANHLGMPDQAPALPMTSTQQELPMKTA